MKKEKFEETFEKWSEINADLFQACKEYIVGVLLKLPNKEIEIECDNQPCVTYDGGRHPEYDANPYSCVSRVYLKENNKVYLEIEDAIDYDIYNITADELHSVAYAVKESLEADYDIEL